MIRRLEIDYFSCMDHSKPQIAMETRTVRIGPLPNRDGMNCSIRDPPANDTDTELLSKTKHPSTESLRANGAGNPSRPRTHWRPQPEPPAPPQLEKEQQQQQQQQQRATHCAPRTTSSETERRISQLRRAGLSISSACSARWSPPSSPRVVPLWKRPLRSFSSRAQREGPPPTALVPVPVPVDPVLGARPNYRGKRVSRKEYPDPTTCQWTFVGACEEQAVEAFEKDLGGSIGVVQLEFEYTTGAFCVERRGDPPAFSEPRLVSPSGSSTNRNRNVNTNTNTNMNINATSVVLVPATTTRGGDRSLSSSLSPSRPPSPRTYRRMLLHPLEYIQTQTQMHHPSRAWCGEPDHETGPLGISRVITPFGYGR